MDSELERLQEIFSLCLEHEPDDRERVLREQCGDDTALQEKVRRLLQRHSDDAAMESGFLRLDASDPERIGPYRLLQRLGEGGMGIVYAAEQREPVRRRVALKVLRHGHGSREVVARFDAERHALALMNHPNIARIFDAGTTADHRPYIVMEFVPGKPITRYCEQNELALRERLHLFCAACDAVQHAHQRGVIHRDLKPSNILVMEDDNRAVVKIIDFGIAKATSRRLTDHTLETKVGSLLGTPDYMSPEQAELSPLDVDTRADIYALGAVLYEMLTGAPPLQLSGTGMSYSEMLRVIHDQQPAPPSQRVGGAIRRQVRGELDWITLKALEKRRNDRYASAVDLERDVRAHLEDRTVVAGPPSPLRGLRKFARRHWLASATVLAFVATLAVSQMMLVQKNRELLTERDRANRAATTAEGVTAFLVDIFNASDEPSEGGMITARELLDRGRRELESDASLPVDVRLNLLFSLAKAYQSLGYYDVAVEIHQQAVTLYEARGVKDPSLKVRILSGLARAHQEGRDTQKARSVLQEAAVLHESTAEIKPAARFEFQHARAETWLELNRLDEAQEAAEQLFRETREYYGNESRQALESAVFLAYTYWTVAEFEKAEKLMTELLPVSRRALGDEHHVTLILESGIGVLYLYLGRWAEAEQLYRKAYGRLLERFGPEAVRTQEAKLTLAITLPNRQEGLRMLNELAEQQREQYGDDAPMLIDTLLNIGWIHSRIPGHESIAAELYDETLERALRILGPDHQTTRLIYYDIAALHARTGQPDTALELLRDVIDNPIIQFKAAHDDDLAVLHENPEFRGLLGRFANDIEQDR